MSLEEFINEVGSLKGKPKELRAGQYIFNTLYLVRPDLADKIVATDIDPFYLDSRLNAFWTFLDENWDK